MKHKSILLISIVLLLNLLSVDTSAQMYNKFILLRSKEKVNYTERVCADKEIEPFTWTYECNDVEKTDYEEFHLLIDMDFSVDAYPYRNNPDLQEDITNFVLDMDMYRDSIVKIVLCKVANEKSVDGIFDKLKKLDGYDVFTNEDTALYNVEIGRYPECKKVVVHKPIKVWVSNGILYAQENYGRSYEEEVSICDVETGKRIKPSDLFKSLRYKSEYNDDTVSICVIRNISKDIITFHSDKDSWSINSITRNSPLLTSYAISLMDRDKGYSISTILNEFGDYVQVFKMEKKAEIEDRTIYIPLNLSGCENTDKIRNKMLEVMFGSSKGDIEPLVLEGVKRWFPEKNKKGFEMLYRQGEGFVSFGFENKSLRHNHDNCFIVFDKKTGNEIKVDDLIKDKEGFMKFINSHNYYMAGFILDTLNMAGNSILEDGQEEFRGYLKHSGGNFHKFDGLSMFPTSWWFPFNKIGKAIIFEFNTPYERIFLNYRDIMVFIDQKYHKTIEMAAVSIR